MKASAGMSALGNSQNKKGSKLKWIGLFIGIILLIIIIVGALSYQTPKTINSSHYNMQVTQVALEQLTLPTETRIIFSPLMLHIREVTHGMFFPFIFSL